MGGIDILVNNVGGGAKTKAEPTHGSLADVVSSWDGTYQLTLRAPVLMSEALAPHFRARKAGRVINIGSNAGRYTGSERGLSVISTPEYAAMKTAISSYTQTLARRLGPFGVTVNCICPGVVITDAWHGNFRRVTEKFEEYRSMTPDEFFAGIAESKFPELVLPVPLGELPTVEDVAQTVVFLSLPESKHMSAQIIAVDSGQVMAR
jgi:NAD(P)-dependent dehydrogenase (short-subunit alcohol dehydrogenase family)